MLLTCLCILHSQSLERNKINSNGHGGDDILCTYIMLHLVGAEREIRKKDFMINDKLS